VPCRDPEKEREEAEKKRLAEVEDLEDALDALFETGRKFLGCYSILSNVERRGGGQGVVQFAQLTGTAELVAIKFFNRVEVRISLPFAFHSCAFLVVHQVLCMACRCTAAH
jgi:hypothetical protein